MTQQYSYVYTCLDKNNKSLNHGGDKLIIKQGEVYRSAGYIVDPGVAYCSTTQRSVME